MASSRLSFGDTLGLGFMILAFFLGAGNWIFPPMAGLHAGPHQLTATLGFLLTGVGLPVLALLSLAIAQGGLNRLGRYLPLWASTLMALCIYLIMVPGFGIPRTALVAYELGAQPFIASDSAVPLFIYSLGYFAVAAFLSLYPGRLLTVIGKLLAPIMLVLVALLGITVFWHPLGPVGPGSGDFLVTPFSKGFLEGYLTMDLLAAMLFGVLITNTLNAKKVTQRRDQFKSLVAAGMIAAAGLCLVYTILFHVGATSATIADGIANGGELLARYVGTTLGGIGQWLVAVIVTLACLTTCVGGCCSFAEYLTERWPRLRYRPTLLVIIAVSVVVTNIGLTHLLNWFGPVLNVLYPVAIVTVLLNLFEPLIKVPRACFYGCLPVALVLSFISTLQLPGFDFIPFFQYGLGWLVPCLVVFLGCQFIALFRAEPMGDKN